MTGSVHPLPASQDVCRFTRALAHGVQRALQAHVQGVCMPLPFFCAEGTADHEESSPSASQTHR